MSPDMKVKNMLYRVRANTFRIARLTERLNFLRLSCLPRSPGYVKSQVMESAVYDVIGEALAEATDLEKKINSLTATLERDTAIAQGLIGKVKNERLRQALTLYFLERKRDGAFIRPLSAEEAAGEMGISDSYLRVLCHRGIATMQKRLKTH